MKIQLKSLISTTINLLNNLQKSVLRSLLNHCMQFENTTIVLYVNFIYIETMIFE